MSRVERAARATRALQPGHQIDLLTSGSALFALASIIWVSRFWSRLPQLTPMRTGLPLSMATCTIARKLSS